MRCPGLAIRTALPAVSAILSTLRWVVSGMSVGRVRDSVGVECRTTGGDVGSPCPAFRVRDGLEL
jgi:hypothetical protein